MANITKYMFTKEASPLWISSQEWVRGSETPYDIENILLSNPPTPTTMRFCLVLGPSPGVGSRE
jgi:hypothetical protein